MSALADYEDFIRYTREYLAPLDDPIIDRAVDMKAQFEAKCQAFIGENGAKRMRRPFPLDGQVFAIGDIHADYCTFVVCLKLARVIPPNFTATENVDGCRWLGGQSIVVQVGDLIGGECPNCNCDYRDGGQQEERNKKECVSFLRIVRLVNVLNQQAPSGAGIVTLMGNHEMRHVLTYNELVTHQSETRLHSQIEVAEVLRRKKCANNAQCPFYTYNRETATWTQRAKPPKELKHSHFNEIEESRAISGLSAQLDPSGYQSHQNLFRPGGLMSNYLGCASEPILMIGNWLFVHGGVTERFLENPLFSAIADDQRKIIFYNMLLKDYILSESKKDFYFLTPGDKERFFASMFEETKGGDRTTVISPIWNNVFGVKLRKKCSNVGEVLERIRLNHMVIGHVHNSTKKWLAINSQNQIVMPGIKKQSKRKPALTHVRVRVILSFALMSP